MAKDAGVEAPKHLHRDARIVGLLFASTTSMIGSGWLFGAYHASRIAGPYSVLSWAVGAAIIALIALCFAELAALFPRSGALLHMSHASHGEGLGRIWSWLLLLAYVAVPAVEAEAIVTYANNYLPILLEPNSAGLLTTTGFVVCALLLGVFAWLNVLAVRTLLGVNTIVTWWKLAIPALTIVAMIAAGSHPGVWTVDPGGYRVSDIFTALPAAGVVFSYLGFRTAIDLGGESSHPGRDIPLAVIGSVAISAVIYILLQVAFVAALRPSDLAHGWAKLTFAGDAGPFAGLASTLGFGWLAALLYIDAYISPGGTALMYMTGGSRILFAVGETSAGPRALTILNEARAPWVAVLVMWAAGVLFLLPFPTWKLMVSYITSVTVLTYGLGPVVLLVLRRNQPALNRPFRLRGAEVVAPVAFVCSNWIIYWTGFKTDAFLFALIAVVFTLYAAYYHLVARMPAREFGWRKIAWLFPWFGGMFAMSALGDIGGGYGLLGFWPGVIAVGLWSLVVFRIALRSALPAVETAETMMRMERAV